MDLLRVLFTGGGTAGHINPALAIANYIKSETPDSSILYVGKKGAMEETLVQKAGFDFEGIEISGFSRKTSLTGLKDNLLTIKRLLKAIVKSKKILKNFKPDFCIGTGGYVSGPILWQAARMNIPIFIHEQNAFPGITTKLLSKKAKCVFLGMQDARKYLSKKCKTKYVGNPVRKDIVTAVKSTSRKVLGLDEKKPLILSFGGSLGAEKINKVILDLILESAKKNEVQHIHAYGRYGKWFIKNLEENGVNLKDHPNFYIKEYLENMPLCLASADLVICRSGAISLSELAVQGKPAILIPSPNVTANHQYFNAKSLAERGAAVLLEEKNLTSESLIKVVKELLQDEKKLKTLKENISKLAIVDSSKEIFKIIKSEVFDYIKRV